MTHLTRPSDSELARLLQHAANYLAGQCTAFPYMERPQ